MAALFFRMMTLLLLVAAAPAAAQAPGERHVAMRLVAESDAPTAGSTVTLAIAATPTKGWHAYWKNPGDAGIETQAAWTLPAGAAVGDLHYPVPGRLIVAGLANFVYEAPFALLTELRVPAGLASGTPLPLRVKLDYLVCTDKICVPESQELATTLRVGDGTANNRAQFDAWRRALPRPLGSSATFAVAEGRFRLSVPFPADAPLADAHFFPLANGAIDLAAPQTVTRDGDRLIVETAAGPIGRPSLGPAHGSSAEVEPGAVIPMPTRLDGVLATGGGRGLALTARPGTIASTADTGSWMVALAAFAGAVLGGLILNVMPCVFPILSLKALSLARGGAEGARAEALAYTAGVVLVCLGLGATLLALRAGGASVGWAFQLTDPRVTALLLLVTGAIALNLAGLFELPVPAFASRGGAAGAFATGALAAFVATPCSGPFMAGAMGAALVLPAAAALLVFAGLGLGIALPFLLVGFVPALRRRLPRPGPWLGTLRRVLAVPMFATALAIAWVVGRQAGGDGLTLALAALLVLALGLWWTGRRQVAGVARAWWPALPAVALALAAVIAVRPATAGVAQVAGAEPFSEARLAALRAEGRPVFAYFTADWCLTCKVNEKAAIETAATADAFRQGSVAVLVGDWTDGDPALGRFIEAHNRAGVPLYLWYAPGAAAPRVLPQVLTPGLLAGLPRNIR